MHGTAVWISCAEVQKYRLIFHFASSLPLPAATATGWRVVVSKVGLLFAILSSPVDARRDYEGARAAGGRCPRAMGGPDKSGLSFATTYVLSATAACVAESSTFPFDIIKTRLMLQGETAAEQRGFAAVPKRGLVGMGKTIVSNEVIARLSTVRVLPILLHACPPRQGILGLYRGLAPACLRHVIYSGTRVMACVNFSLAPWLASSGAPCR